MSRFRRLGIPWRIGETLSPPDALIQISSDIPIVPSKRDFARRVDSLSSKLFAHSVDKYPSEEFAKLMIIRIGNLLFGHHATHHGHTSLVGNPFQVMLDPSNTCQLQCPGCVHSPLVEERAKTTGLTFHWPKGIMSDNCYDRIVKQFAPYAFASVFFNYGEPLINKNFATMVRRAKDFHHFTWASSNLSLSFDIDAVVSSGLDFLTMSIDGASQETLGQYRRRAKWDLCLANMRDLVQAKHRLNSPIRLCWQFLTFEHNVHEVPIAIEMAKTIGLDEFHVGTPTDVSWDDPSVKATTSPFAGQHSLTSNQTRMGPLSSVAALGAHADLINQIFSDGWEGRLNRLGIEEEPSRAGCRTCEWLYQNITVDSSSRLMPCCAAPTTTRHLVYGSLDDDGDAINTKEARLSRLAFADRSAYEAETSGRTNQPYCATCPGSPPHQFGRETNLAVSLAHLDGGVLLNRRAVLAMTRWND